MIELTKFINNVRDIINDNSDECVKRQHIDENGNITNKLDLKNTLYMSAITLNSSGMSSAISDFAVNKHIHVSKSALVKKRSNDNTHICFKNVNDSIIEMIYNTDNDFIKPNNLKIDTDCTSYSENSSPIIDTKLYVNYSNKRFIACDGMQINVDRQLINDNDIKRSDNGNYGVCIISSLVDVINNIPINYGKTECNEHNINLKKVNEITGFLNQLSYLSSNDIIIFDRWYYSEQFIKQLNDKNIGYIFRMKSNSNFFKKMKSNSSKIVDFLDRSIQLFKYKIKDENYFILTSIVDKISINEIKALYRKRWQVETDNKKFKYDILHDSIRSKKYNSFLVDKECIRFVSIVSSFIEYLGKYKIKAKHKINSKNCLKLFYDKLLNLILYEPESEETNKQIFIIIGVIYTTLVAIVKNREYPRRRVKPSTKWNNNGNRYGNKNK